MAENNIDDFMRAVEKDGNQDASQEMSRSQTNRSSVRKSTLMSSTMLKKKADPYDLDFTDLRKNYAESSSVKIPFVKSSFTHYSKCPRNMEINDKEYKDLVITMEIVQAPTCLTYTQLDSPEEARKKRKLAELKAKRDEERKAKKDKWLEEQEQKRLEKEARKKEREVKRAFRNNQGIQDEDEDDETSESEFDPDEEYLGSDDDDDFDDDQLETEGMDEDYDDEMYGDEETNSAEDYTGTEEEEETEEEGADREYTGDMFKKGKRVKFEASPFQTFGQQNEKLGTTDYACISLWTTGGKNQRYTRLKDTTLRVPPIGKARKFRVGHDAKRLYYLGELDKVKKLVIIYLKDLSHEFIDLGPDSAKITSFDGSSLFRNYLCYAIKEKQEVEGQGKKYWRYTKNFSVLNFRTQEKVWELPDCEYVLFQGKEAAKQKMVTFEPIDKKLRDEPASDSSDDEADDETVLKCEEESEQEIDSDADEAERNAEGDDDWTSRFEKLHRGIVVIKSKYYDEKIEPEKKKEEDKADDDADGDEAKETKQEPAAGAEDEKAKPKITSYRKIEAFLPQWGKKVSQKRLIFETKREVKMSPVPEDAAFDTNAETTKLGKGKVAKELHESPLQVVSDNTCSVVSLIVVGLLGEQHLINTFTPVKQGPSVTAFKAANLDLEYNMNSHIRNCTQIFICETYPNNDVIAKPVQLGSDKDDKIEKPPVSFTKPERGFAKDCWILPAAEDGGDDEDEEESESHPVIMTLCKSSTDEYINADCVTAMAEIEDGATKWKTSWTSAKIRAQEIDLNYPCLVANVGLSILMIQSTTCPDQVNTFNLSKNQEFICFADYRRLEDIGFKDARDAALADIVPFSETGDKIAFVTRRFCWSDEHEDDEGEKLYVGEMLLNVLSIDSYSQPMQFDLFTTNYEACMEEGMADDAIQRCVAMQVTSQRGLDVAFVCQYNDRIIYDCVTSTTQEPLRFPLPDAKQEKAWRETDPDFQKRKGEIHFEDIEVFKGAEMVRQPMIMDDNGAIYFMIKTPSGTVKVLRTDPLIEMGGDGFIKSVFTLRSRNIYFLLFREGLFYIMDESKKIRKLRPDEETNMWVQEDVLELPAADAKKIIYSDFDDFCISDSVLHTNENMYFMIDSRAKDNPTWAGQNVMMENHLHVAGPRYAKESGLIWYVEQYVSNAQDVGPPEFEEQNAFDAIAEMKSKFRGFSVVLQPLGDLSYLDLLPQRGQNNNNFVSFVTDQHILVSYAGRYLIFNRVGHFQGSVQFNGVKAGFDEKRLKLMNVSDSGRFFVFQGPNFLSPEEKKAQKEKAKEKKERKKAAQKNLAEGANPLANGLALVADKMENAVKKSNEKFNKKASGGKKAPRFYIFKLHVDQKLGMPPVWSFQPFDTKLYPFIEPEKMVTLTQRMSYDGLLSQCQIECKDDDDTREMQITVKNYKSQDPNAEVVQERRGIFSFGGNDGPVEPQSSELYRLSFDAMSTEKKGAVLDGKISKEQRNIDLGAGSHDHLVRLQRRRQQIERAWVFDNFIVAKSGNEIKYVKREQRVLGMAVTSSIDFSVDLGPEVWIENIFSTGIEDLVQLFIIDDEHRRLYIITWNLQLNREHNMFQTTYAPDIFPENLIMKGKHTNKQQDLNYFMDSYAIINLETNLPVQFFDTENETDVLPKGPMHAQVEGMKRVSGDWSRYLDMTKPGRVHHFISLADLLYWERYQVNKDRHEITKGVMSTFSPIARFPNGISVFHYFATNVKVLNTVEDSMTIAKQNRTDDVRVTMLPLVFLHSNPKLNTVPGKRTTPIHIAIDKQSPVAFELMFQMLTNQHKVCVTSQLLDVIDQIVNTESQAVLDFFNNSFLITDQFAGLRALDWEEEGEEKICATPSAYLTDEYLQSLVRKSVQQDEEEEGADLAHHLTKNDGLLSLDDDDAPYKYDQNVEPLTHKASDSNVKQIEAKILDFNWVFIGDNSSRLLDALAETENDEIFAQSQIRVFIEFMWQGYYDSIFTQLFLPFIVYFASFVTYSGYFAKNESDELSIPFIAEIICIVLFGKIYFTFVILEIIQIRSNGLAYFFDIWNLIDISSLGLNALYVYGEITNGLSYSWLQIIGSCAVMLMWFKLFYWMRLFKPFSAFIRMISEIIKDIQVFMVMLIISLMAFANIVFVLNANRLQDNADPIFDSVVGFPPLDAIIHAYLTGLGDFNKDNYSAENASVVWIMFILCTIIVQLIFMNLLIAIMGESFARITAIMQQSTLKEICGIMVDHIWLLKISEIFENQRYILWLTPDTSTGGGTIVERQLSQLQELIKTNSEAQEGRIIRAIAAVQEDVATVQSNVDELKKAQQRGGEDGETDDSDEY